MFLEGCGISARALGRSVESCNFYGDGVVGAEFGGPFLYVREKVQFEDSADDCRSNGRPFLTQLHKL